MTECVLYWLHDEYCICLQKHGYVGITTNWTRRLSQHQNNKSFPVNFEWSIIFTGTRAECLVLEYQLRPKSGIGWNRSQGGKPVVEFTDEVRGKMSAAAKVREFSVETREKLRISHIGKTNKGRVGQKKSDEERRKISIANIGKKPLPEAIAKMAESKIGKAYHVTPHSEVTKLKISLKKRGVPIHADEHKVKLQNRMKGNSYTKGKPWSLARRLAQSQKEK